MVFIKYYGELLLSVLDPKRLPTAYGLRWLEQGLLLYKKAPIQWVSIFLVWLALHLLLSSHVLLTFFLYFLAPVLTGGVMLTCDKLIKDNTIVVTDLFSSFAEHGRELSRIGAYYLLGLIAIAILLFLFGVIVSSIAKFMGLDVQMWLSSILNDEWRLRVFLMVIISLSLLCTIPLFMALWFSPALVVFQKIAAKEAMILSYYACLYNIRPFTYYGVIVSVLLIVAILPFMLGLLILIPVIWGSIYVAYQDIFPIVKSDNTNSSDSNPKRIVVAI